MARLTNIINAEDFFARADSFLLAERVIEIFDVQVVAAAAQGVVVCGSCAVELYLKVIAQLERNGPPLEGHDLEKLVRDISGESYRRLKLAWLREAAEPIKTALANRHDPQWKNFPVTFEEALKQCSEAFVEWRYGNGGLTSGWFLSQITNELRNIILELRPDWQPTQLGRTVLDPKTNPAGGKNQSFLRRMDWSKLENKPAAFNVEVRRRTGPNNSGSR